MTAKAQAQAAAAALVARLSGLVVDPGPEDEVLGGIPLPLLEREAADVVLEPFERAAELEDEVAVAGKELATLTSTVAQLSASLEALGTTLEARDREIVRLRALLRAAGGGPGGGAGSTDDHRVPPDLGDVRAVVREEVRDALTALAASITAASRGVR